ncbi:hypothetical protein JMG10_34290 [Nostoc ellipsosporum NOK]|nr:hypothetical protein [Nostoc ellipsosporum NOK]
MTAQQNLSNLLTVRTGCELVGHEAIVLEWYLDSVGVGTWGVGVTNASGHGVDRYKDRPQTVERCLEVYAWLLRTRYVPAVLKAFEGMTLSEAQFAAALSFHYNTGAILTTDWVKLVKQGQPRAARMSLVSHYLNGGMLAGRRKAEAALFFDGTWSHADGMATVYPVLKPSYRPAFKHPMRVDIRADMAKALAA